MLSRVANRIYWMARYLERAENTARVVNVNTHLLLDIPGRIEIGWQPLIEITGSGDLFKSLNEEYSERAVTHFLIGDERNPVSILSALGEARENARTVRDIIPREAWEQVNELYMDARDDLKAAYNQRRRYDYLNRIILHNQTITGLLAGTMTHDFAYAFLRMGRNLERGDMTTRIIDVRSADLLPEEADGLTPFENIQWMSVLKSLTGYQMYRRDVRMQVRRPEALAFLFQNALFPRSVYHTLCELISCLEQLPRSEPPMRAVAHLQRVIRDTQPESLTQHALHQFIDDLQLGLAQVNDAISETYFAVTELAESA